MILQKSGGYLKRFANTRNETSARKRGSSNPLITDGLDFRVRGINRPGQGLLTVLLLFLMLTVAPTAPADPPPWAPAHGYRSKQPQYSHDEYEYGGGGFYLPWLTRGYHSDYVGGGRCNREKLGAVLGGVIGGAAGSQIGHGNSRTIAAITGSVIGILVGQSIGRQMDEIDQNCTGQTLEYAPDHAPVSWRDPDSGNAYTVTPVRTYPAPGNRYCREYQTDAIIGGRRQQVYGTACRQPDGSWLRM
jgi:surface antigen